MFDEQVYATHVERIRALQVHPVPDKVTYPRGPFPDELFEEPEIVFAKEEDPQYGATVQNNFKPPRYLRCASCNKRVPETETDSHECGE